MKKPECLGEGWQVKAQRLHHYCHGEVVVSHLGSKKHQNEDKTLMVNSTSLAWQRIIYFEVKLKVQRRAELSHCRLSRPPPARAASAAPSDGSLQRVDERSPLSASGLLGKVRVTTALLDDRPAAPAWMCHLTAQLGWCWHCIE